MTAPHHADSEAARALIDAWLDLTCEHLVPRLRILRAMRDGREVWGQAEAFAAGREVHIAEVRAIDRGGGRLVMQCLCDLADQYGVTLDLCALPIAPIAGGGLALSPERLRAWYEGFGFESYWPAWRRRQRDAGSMYMHRAPRAP